jgi:hypothetical protein
VCTTDYRPSLPTCGTHVEDQAHLDLSLISPTFTATINMIFATNLAPRNVHFLAPLSPLRTSSDIYAQLDDGANISGTPNLSLLTNVTLLQDPLTISAANKREFFPMISSSAGWFLFYFCNSPPFRICMHYCPNLVETIASPQHMCMPGHSPFDEHTTVDRHSAHPLFSSSFVILLTASLSVTAPLIKNNNIYFLPNDCAIRLLPPFEVFSLPNYGINDLGIQDSLNWMPSPSTVPASLPT